MNMRFALVCATSLLAFAATPAMAQDGDFTGPWVAAVAGYDINKTGSTADDDLNDNRDESIEGLLYGAAVGYDYDLGKIIVGAEAELTGSTAEDNYDNTGETFALGNVDAGRDIYVGGRVGFKAMPSMLVYAKAGYTNARFNYVGSDNQTDYNVNLDTDGYRLGAGVEQRVGANAFARLEYRYSNYSKGELDFETDGLDDSDRFDIDTDRHQIVASVGMRF